MINRRGFIAGSMAAAVAAKVAKAEISPVVPKDLGKAKILPPGRYDSHTHIYEDVEAKPDELFARMQEAGMAGGCVYSREQAPEPRLGNTTRMTPEQIVDNVINWCSASPTLFPFYWIDPSRPDSVDLVDMAVEKGICGFKVIRSNGYPCDGYALDCYRRMAHYGKPVTFHSGILYDGMPSSEYFRPIAFEGLIRVPRLRFCLAHIAWPWCEECMATFGKINDAGYRLRVRCGRRDTRDPKDSPTMFVDSTPGAHNLFRRNAFTLVYGAEHPMKNNLMFGTDNSVHNYRVAYNRKYQDFDDAIFREFKVEPKLVESYYRGALQRFLYA